MNNESEQLTCGYCGHTDHYDRFDIGGADIGNAFCNHCNTEIDINTGEPRAEHAPPLLSLWMLIPIGASWLAMLYVLAVRPDLFEFIPVIGPMVKGLGF